MAFFFQNKLEKKFMELKIGSKIKGWTLEGKKFVIGEKTDVGMTQSNEIRKLTDSNFEIVRFGSIDRRQTRVLDHPPTFPTTRVHHLPAKFPNLPPKSPPKP